MTGTSKIDTKSINAIRYTWFLIYKNEIKLKKKVRKNDRPNR